MNCTKTKRNNSVAYFCGNCTMCKLPREIVWILINILITSDKYRHGKMAEICLPKEGYEHYREEVRCLDTIH